MKRKLIIDSENECLFQGTINIESFDDLKRFYIERRLSFDRESFVIDIRKLSTKLYPYMYCFIDNSNSDLILLAKEKVPGGLISRFNEIVKFSCIQGGCFNSNFIFKDCSYKMQAGLEKLFRC